MRRRRHASVAGVARHNPKQFLPLFGTLDLPAGARTGVPRAVRAADRDHQRATSASSRAEQAPASSASRPTIVLEPCGAIPAPAIAAGGIRPPHGSRGDRAGARRRSRRARHRTLFVAACRRRRGAAPARIVTFGVSPSGRHRDTAISAAASRRDRRRARSRAFVEKPDPATAARYIAKATSGTAATSCSAPIRCSSEYRRSSRKRRPSRPRSAGPDRSRFRPAGRRSRSRARRRIRSTTR